MKSKKYFDAVDLSKTSIDKTISCEVLFATSFISELIHRSFPKKTIQQNQSKKQSKNHTPLSPSNKTLCIESRMRAWNYLSSLLSQQGILDQHILVKSLYFITDYFEKNN